MATKTKINWTYDRDYGDGWWFGETPGDNTPTWEIEKHVCQSGNTYQTAYHLTGNLNGVSIEIEDCDHHTHTDAKREAARLAAQMAGTIQKAGAK